MSNSIYQFSVPPSQFLTAADYDLLCAADARGDMVYCIMPDGERVHINHIAFDVPRRAPAGVLFSIKREIPIGEYLHTKSARRTQ